jgi:curved DNA-binding protein CbpA
MRQLNAAWHVLSDPGRRAAYDRLLTRARPGGTNGAQGFGAAHAPHAAGERAHEWAPDLDGLDLTADEILDLLDDEPVRQTMALSGWWAILPPGTLVAAAATMFLGVWFMSPPMVALGVGLLVLAGGLFVLAPLRAMARKRD